MFSEFKSRLAAERKILNEVIAEVVNEQRKEIIRRTQIRIKALSKEAVPGGTNGETTLSELD